MNLINLAAILILSFSSVVFADDSMPKKEINFHPVKKSVLNHGSAEVRPLNVSTKICEVGQTRYRVASASDEARCIDHAGKIMMTDEPANKFQEMGMVVPTYKDKKTPNWNELDPLNHNSLKTEDP